MADRQREWELCLHRVSHETTQAARPGACRFPLGDILRKVERPSEGEGGRGCPLDVDYESKKPMIRDDKKQTQSKLPERSGWTPFILSM